MGELIYLKGPEIGGGGKTSGPMRQPIISGGGGSAPQCERLGVVCERVLRGLIVSRADISVTKS